jgi:hypothetical protein
MFFFFASTLVINLLDIVSPLSKFVAYLIQYFLQALYILLHKINNQIAYTKASCKHNLLKIITS